MKLGAVAGMRDNPDAFARHLKELEDAGVEYLWAGEAYTADAVSTMGFMAAVTSRAQIGSAILPLYTRTPSLLAMTAVGLDKLSGGRFILGIGAGVLRSDAEALGLLDADRNEMFAEAIDHILARAKAHGLVAAIHNGTPEAALKRIAKGFQFVTVSSDARLMAAGAQQVVAKMAARQVNPTPERGVY